MHMLASVSKCILWKRFRYVVFFVNLIYSILKSLFFPSCCKMWFLAKSYNELEKLFCNPKGFYASPSPILFPFILMGSDQLFLRKMGRKSKISFIVKTSLSSSPFYVVRVVGGCMLCLEGLKS